MHSLKENSYKSESNLIETFKFLKEKKKRLRRYSWLLGKSCHPGDIKGREKSKGNDIRCPPASGQYLGTLGASPLCPVAISRRYELLILAT